MEKTVFVVDDEQAVRKVLTKAFERAGYSVENAEDAETALAMLESKTYHVFFIDMKLPGMDGMELAHHIREKNPFVCLFAMTGYSALFELATCREAGFDDYFTKPLDIPGVIKATGEAFNKVARWLKL